MPSNSGADSSPTEDEGCFSTNEADPGTGQLRDTRHPCNDSSSSSEEDVRPRLGDGIGRLILAVARDLIRGSISQSRALDIIEDLRLHDSRGPQPGGNRRSHSGGPHPGGGRVTIGPEQGEGCVGAGPSDRTSATGRPAPERAGPSPSGHRSSVENVVPLGGLEKEDGTHMEEAKLSGRAEGIHGGQE